MNINRNNYEEYFLMYIDNELSADERRAVELFVQQNQDLQEELEALQFTIAAPEYIAMPGKEQLLHSAQDMDIASIQEKFLLYIDNELTVDEGAAVEKFVLQHPEHQEEFLQIKSTVLQPEAIICPDKESLYKTERKGRVIMLAFQRLAVAAIFFGLVAGGWWMFVNPEADVQPKQQGSNPIARTKVIENQKATTPVTNSEASSYNNQTVQIVGGGREEQQAAFASKEINAQNAPNQKQQFAHPVEIDEVEVLFANRLLPNKEVQEMNREAQAKILEDVLRQMPNELNGETSKESFVVNTEEPQTLKMLDVEADDSEAVLVGNLQLSKTKIKGIFKKAGRLLTGNKPADNTGKLQVAGFEIERRETRN